MIKIKDSFKISRINNSIYIVNTSNEESKEITDLYELLSNISVHYEGKNLEYTDQQFLELIWNTIPYNHTPKQSERFDMTHVWQILLTYF